MLGVMAWLMPLSVAISTFGSANGTIFAAGRLCKKNREISDFMKFIKILINFFRLCCKSRRTFSGYFIFCTQRKFDSSSSIAIQCKNLKFRGKKCNLRSKSMWFFEKGNRDYTAVL